MQIYRISKTKYSGQLVASGKANRWNKQSQFVIYTAACRSLACLELVVHLDQASLQDSYRVTVINIPDDLEVFEFTLNNLPTNWHHLDSYMDCQQMGSDWISSQKSCLLKVPSSIIHQEYNYIINTDHPDFKQISILEVESFQFDSRIKI